MSRMPCPAGGSSSARRSGMLPPAPKSPGAPAGLALGKGRAAEGDGDLVRRLADRDAELVQPPGRSVQLQPGAADGGDVAAGPVVDPRAHAEHAFCVFLVIDPVSADL